MVVLIIFDIVNVDIYSKVFGFYYCYSEALDLKKFNRDLRLV